MNLATLPALTCFVCCLGVSAYLWIPEQPSAVPLAVPKGPPVEQSSDLAADIALMWETSSGNCSSDRAVQAAYRVFNTVKLKGKSRFEVIQILGDPRHPPDGAYRPPFHPQTQPDSLAYRFDTGFSGVEYVVEFDGADKVSVLSCRVIE